MKNADPPNSVRLLCEGAAATNGRRAADERDELALVHSITSSAVASSEGGTVRPSARAVGMLMTKSNLVDCTTGRSAGLAPLRMRAVYSPVIRNASGRLVP